MAPSALAYASAGWGNVTCTTALHVYLSYSALPMQRGPWLEEEARHRAHDEEESEVCERESPSTTAIDAISKRDLSLLVQRPHHQVDHDGCAHGQEAEAQEPVHERDIRDAGQLLTHHELVGDAGQNPDERDTEPIAERRPIHPEHREREQNDHHEGNDDQAPHIEGLSLHLNAQDERRRHPAASSVGCRAIPYRQTGSCEGPLRNPHVAGEGTGCLWFHVQQDLIPIEPEDFKDGFQPMAVEWESAHVELRLRRRVQGLDQGRGAVGLDAQHHAVLLVQARGVDEDHLRIPASRELIELVAALEDFFLHAHNSRVEGLAWVLPR